MFFQALSLALCLVSSPSPSAQKAVAVEPNPAAPGQTVTLRWYFTGTKVVLSGGRFGKGVVVTGRTSATDRPQKTTRYMLDVWYRAPGKNEAGQTVEKSLHARYPVVVEVQSAPALLTYQDPRGWQVGYLKGWKHDTVALPDPANNGLVYFQQEDDSVERLAVSILPAQEMTCERLMQKVLSSLPASYDQVEVLAQEETTHADVPALLAVFSGIDQAHPGTRTQSVVLTFVRAGRAYVVSARTPAARFKARQAVLEQMVRSFAFTRKALGAAR